ncbi:hypothetical protein PS645_00035 [Pseudomonas fluorescens]|uniref:Uncharacterized protein n=1 Tax=Pseudomonas fluorescens TaxID=294 RepID=A0A5E6NZ27_PSEFL|nr:hypothetical protein [Pseudomonas fluorescens]VVM36186.1 hypothetical protein PS645_00035 [Pseudomonas fluorescens]
MEFYPVDDDDPRRRHHQIGKAVGLAADEVEMWVSSVEEDGSGMGYVVHFSERTPTEILAKVEGLGSDRTINIGPLD